MHKNGKKKILMYLLHNSFPYAMQENKCFQIQIFKIKQMCFQHLKFRYEDVVLKNVDC